jgi:hypothetical protein
MLFDQNYNKFNNGNKDWLINRCKLIDTKIYKDKLKIIKKK